MEFLRNLARYWSAPAGVDGKRRAAIETAQQAPPHRTQDGDRTGRRFLVRDSLRLAAGSHSFTT